MTTFRSWLVSVAAAVALWGSPWARAQDTYAFTTLAGMAGQYGAVDGTGTAARFSYNLGPLAVDASGNIYVGDGSTVRRITPEGVVTTLAGTSGQTGSVDGTGVDARFTRIQGLAADAAGNIYATDSNQLVRKITSAGVVTTLAGAVGVTGHADGTGAEARFNEPAGIAVDTAGNVFVADWNNHTIRKISTAGVVSTFAGSAELKGARDATGTAARLSYPGALAIDAANNLYVDDSGNRLLRKITPEGGVTTLAGSTEQSSVFAYRDGTGTEARLPAIGEIAVDAAGNLVLTDSSYHTIRRVTPTGVVTTVAGMFGQSGSADGVGGAASFYFPFGIGVAANGTIYVADWNPTVRRGLPTTQVTAPIVTMTNYQQNQSVVAGGTAQFEAAASSNAPLTYEWLHDGVVVAGATGSKLSLTGIAAKDAGTYTVNVSNSAGVVNATAGTLTVFTPPVTTLAVKHSQAGGSFLWGIAAGDGLIVTVGTQGRIITSLDGETWTTQTSGTSAWLLGVAYGGGKFVAVGEAGTILQSTDGASWTSVTETGTTERLNSVVYGAGKFVAVGEHGTVVTWTDGALWTLRSLPTTYPAVGWLRGLAYNAAATVTVSNPGREPVVAKASFCAAGEGGLVFYSADGETWSQGSSFYMNNARVDAEAVTAVDSYAHYAGVGASGGVFTASLTVYGRITLYSGLGVTSYATGSAVRLRGIATGANALFVTGEGGVVLSAPAPDGPWTSLTTGTTANLVAGVFVGNSLYVVGENETILQSTPLYTSRLVNISSRGYAGKDDATLISGFVVQGSSPKQVLLRAVGPTFTATNALTGAITTPQLTLTDAAGKVLARNAGWSTDGAVSELEAAAAKVGATPLIRGALDAALLVTLDPGLYSTQVSVQDGSPGLCLVEAYDAEASNNAGSRAINISTRAQVGTGDEILIAGFVISGDSARRVLIRGAGPALAARFGLSGVLEQPQLTLSNQAGKTLQVTAAWSDQTNVDEIRDAAARVGAFDFDDGSTDAAMVVTLLPGVYTVQVSGRNNTTGLALVEVYDLP